jgi:hypothetical protein
VRVHAAIIVLHSAEVVHIPHESRSSLIVGYPLYRWVPLHTFGVCARTSLQGCSMVFPSLQHTHWGFTGGVSLDHQGPPLASCGSQESPLPYPLIPSHKDPKRVHSICIADWYAKLGSTTYYTRSYPYRLIFSVFMGGRSINWSLDLDMMPTTGFRSPLDMPRSVRIYRTQFQTRHPKSLFFTLTGNNNDLQGDNR